MKVLVAIPDIGGVNEHFERTILLQPLLKVVPLRDAFLVRADELLDLSK